MFDDINLLPGDHKKKEQEKKSKLNTEEYSEEELSFPAEDKIARDGFDFKQNKKSKADSGWQASSDDKGEKKPTHKSPKVKGSGFFSKFTKAFNRKKTETNLPKKKEISASSDPNKKPFLPKDEGPKMNTNPIPFEPGNGHEHKLDDTEKQKIVESIKKEVEKDEIKKSEPEKHKAEGFMTGFNKMFHKKKEQKKEIEPKTSENKPPKPVIDKKTQKEFTNGDNLKSPSDSLEVNLVPEISRIRPLGKIISIVIMVIIINFLAIGIIYGGVILYSYKNQVQAKIQDQRINEKLKEIEKISSNEQEAQAMMNDINQIENVLENHTYWTKFFSFLEDYTLDNVYFINFSAAQSGGVNLSAKTTDYLSVAKQLVVLEDAKEYIKRVTIMSASKTLATEETPAEVTFDISLQLKPNIFLKPLYNE